MCEKERKLVGFYSGHLDAATDPARLTDDVECDAVLLTVWTTEDDGADTLKPIGPNFTYLDRTEEIYWGFDNVCVHQIFPGETSDYIWVKNAKDISIRRNKNKGNVVRVGFSCFKFIDVTRKDK